MKTIPITPEEDSVPVGSILSEEIAAAISDGDFFDATRQLFTALKAHPGDVRLQLLHGQVLARIGDYEGAATLLLPHVDAPEMTEQTRQALARVLLETGDPEGAFAVACRMICEDCESVELYDTAGSAAEELGRGEEAATYRKSAFRLDSSDASIALQVLEHYCATGQTDLHDVWLGEVLELIEARGDAAVAVELAEWALSQRKEQALSRALAIVARNDIGRLPALIEKAVSSGMQSALACLAVLLARMPNLSEQVARTVRALAEDWAQSAPALLAEGRSGEAYALAAACLEVQGSNAAARRVQRSVLDELWTAVHSVKDDDTAVLALCEAAGDMVYGRRNLALLFARALLRNGRLAEAEEVARKLHSHLPDDVDVCANRAHIAALQGDFPTALELYGKLAAESADSIARYRDRMEAFLASAGPKGLRYIRNATSDRRFDEAFAAYQLLQQHTDVSPDQLAAEARRMLVALRARLRQLDASIPSEEAMHITRLMLSLAPDDPRMLRRAAIECMKVEDFGQAIHFWRRLEHVSPDLKSAAHNIRRCEILAQRQVRNAQGKPGVRSLAA